VELKATCDPEQAAVTLDPSDSGYEMTVTLSRDRPISTQPFEIEMAAELDGQNINLKPYQVRIAPHVRALPSAFEITSKGHSTITLSAASEFRICEVAERDQLVEAGMTAQYTTGEQFAKRWTVRITESAPATDHKLDKVSILVEMQTGQRELLEVPILYSNITATKYVSEFDS